MEPTEPDLEETDDLVPKELPRGGEYALWVVILNIGISFAFYGWSSVLDIYLIHFLSFDRHLAGFLVNLLLALSYATSVIGIYMAETRLGHFSVVIVGSTFSLLGFLLILNSDLLRKYDEAILLPMSLAGIFVFYIGSGSAKTSIASFVLDQLHPSPKLAAKGLGWFYLGLQLAGIGGCIVLSVCLRNIPAWISVLIMVIVLVVCFVAFIIPSSSYQIPKKKKHAIGKISSYIFKCISCMDAEDQNRISHFDEVKKVLNNCTLFIAFPVFWAVFFQMYSRWMDMAEDLDRTLPLVDVEMPSALTVVLSPFFDIILIPLFSFLYMLTEDRLDLTPFRKVLVGFIFCAGSVACCCYLNYEILHGPKHALSILWIIPQHFMISCAQILISITGFDEVYREAHPSFKESIKPIFLCSIAFGNLLVAFLQLIPMVAWKHDLILLGLVAIAILLLVRLAPPFSYRPTQHSRFPIHHNNTPPPPSEAPITINS